MRRALALLALTGAACGDVNTCNTGPAGTGDVCVPPALAANIATTIELRELCGPSCTQLPGCSAIFRDGQLVLDIQQEVCLAASGEDCPVTACQQRSFPCKLPPLAPGDWPLSAPGGTLRLVRVREGGDATCRFPDAGVQ